MNSSTDGITSSITAASNSTTRKRAADQGNKQQMNVEMRNGHLKRSGDIVLKRMYESDGGASDAVHNSSPLLPLRRSKREKRLIFANFTPSEIARSISNKHTINLLDDEEDDLDPYEKLLSPMAKKKRKFVEHPISHNHRTRSSIVTKVTRQTNNESKDDISDNSTTENDISDHDDNDNHDDQDDNGDQDDHDDDYDNDDDIDEAETSYNLRKRRPVVYQYQPVIQVVDKKTRKNSDTHRRSSYHYKSAAYQPRKGHVTKNSFRHKAHQDSTTSSSNDSDEERFKRRKKRSMKRSRLDCLPMNFTPDDTRIGPLHDRLRIGTSLADISPMNIDNSVTFDSIGGLNKHIRSLKEMIMFPLMYPEVFEKFNINPPRGVIFYGPPGCGKTLVARALANECSKDNRKIAFFMRKGADCLSKWVGESERQLRLLFDQAYQMRPSILFFDEIDGLAPVRSTRQDQIHSSIVSTLLALMDGLDSRGEVVVIGATNRIDCIDPALRRPGRFDREFIFPLPTRQDRYSILQIHTSSWCPPLSDESLNELSELTVGYCGADIKGLCTEATLRSLRRQYPQIYQSSDKLLIDVSKLVVSSNDFHLAYKDIIPTGQRSNMSLSKPLSNIVFPLIGNQFEELLKKLLFVFPEAWKCVHKGIQNANKRFESVKEKRRELNTIMESSTPSSTTAATVLSNSIEGVYYDINDIIGGGSSSHALPKGHRPRLLLTGKPGMGQSDHLSLALLHACEDLPLKLLDTPTLLGSITQSPEEICVQVFREACRIVPCIIYMPRIITLWEAVTNTFKATFKSLLDSLPCDLPLLLLATAEQNTIPDDITCVFNISVDNCFNVQPPQQADRECFFYNVLLKQPLLNPPHNPILSSSVICEPLPFAPPSKHRELSEVETNKVFKQREAVLRELRVFLRENTNRLLAERKFKEFTKPVNYEEVPDYYDIITNPMDLSTVMKKIDERKYDTPKQWLKDIDLITTNSLEYNPENDSDSRLLRHRALALQDLAHSIFDHELNEEFEKQCEDMNETFKRINNTSPLKECTSGQSSLLLYDEGSSSLDIRRSLRRMGLKPHLEGFPYYGPPKPRTPKKNNNIITTTSNSDCILAAPNSDRITINRADMPTVSVTTRRLSFDSIGSTSSRSIQESSINKAVVVDKDCLIINISKLKELFNRIVLLTNECSVDANLKIHSTLSQLIYRHRMNWNKGELLKELEITIDIIQKEL